jgi:hypothetical protein
VSVNGSAVTSAAAFRSLLSRLAIGDTTTVVVRRGGERTVTVPISGYERVRVRLEELPTLSDAQRRARERWMHGDTTTGS